MKTGYAFWGAETAHQHSKGQSPLLGHRAANYNSAYPTSPTQGAFRLRRICVSQIDGKSMVDFSALNSARRKVYARALPLLFVCYVIAYIDRTNISVAQLTMAQSLPAFTKAVIGWGAGIFFFGYFLLEIPGTLIVERWSARKWICRIMVTWGIVASLTAFVKTPFQFYSIRFLLGLAEAGFFPGVIVYLTHWFPKRDRAQALAWFLIASPIAMIIGNYLSGLMLEIGKDGNPDFMGLKGWQVIFVVWGIPAVLLGFYVLIGLTDRPREAKWLTNEERDALETQLANEKAEHKHVEHMSVFQGLSNPNVLMLALAYFGVVTGNYGIEMFLPAILEDWYGLGSSTVTKLAMIPSVLVIIGQLSIGKSSDYFHERRWHAILPIVVGALGLIFATLTQGNLVLTMICFTIAAAGMKSYMPAFWSLPNVYLTAAAAAGSIGLINSIGNLGGHLGPSTVGMVKTLTGSYDIGIYFLATTCLISSVIIFLMPWIHARLERLKGPAGKLQALGAVILIGATLYFGVSWWIAQQLKPWGPARTEVVNSQATDDDYLKQFAGSFEDWFSKRPRIRDALTFRLDQLTNANAQVIEKPPAHLTDPAKARLTAALKECNTKIAALTKLLGEKDTTKDKRYKKTVAAGLEDADAIVRDTQKQIATGG